MFFEDSIFNINENSQVFDKNAVMNSGRNAANDDNFQCWTCDSEPTYDKCFLNGKFEECGGAEKAKCFVEVRKTYSNIRLTTGCKTKNVSHRS